ncbi:Ubiquitin conjugating enzyme (UbcF) [Penicillium alfredii]|uniref:Ubiquitin conjugating enzyme (UbcF) n=1 Tax=Penicillium alfredii TaxID=1506179 RepID=A0A9W9KDW8_9EURO|nr:Ubiquitin conjugating enzyme (UbcF) [Penicillium alfredii]KAJ5102133.1 Ubiquitin conjugating enzyme (UbcF) [Penicillium alfredii]
MTSPSTRRLLKESTDLHKNPSPYFTAAPISDSNLHDWHFTLAGPPAPSPYRGGLYHGRITFPGTYPLRPPSFRFLTPSGRFEVNREICLSISGHHEETWQPAWGVRTALLAIRSEIMGSEAKGQVGGMEGSDAVRVEYARLSRGWACRECRVENQVAMREWWAVCREKGVEVDEAEDGVELFAGPGPGPGGGGGADDAKKPEEEQSVPGNQQDERKDAETTEKTHSSATDASSKDQVEVQDQPAPSAVPAPATPAPTPTTAPATASAPSVSTSQSTRPPSQAPSDGVWLDRAIIGVFIALVLLVLRRVVNVDDL